MPQEFKGLKLGGEKINVCMNKLTKSFNSLFYICNFYYINNN